MGKSAGGGDFIASEEANVKLLRGSVKAITLVAAKNILRYGIPRMARNASKIFMASIRKNFLFN